MNYYTISIAFVVMLFNYSCTNSFDDTEKVTIQSLTGDQLAKCLPAQTNSLLKDSASIESEHIGTSGAKYHSYARQQYRSGAVIYFVEIIDYKNDEKTLKGLVHMFAMDSIIRNAEYESQPFPVSLPNSKAITTIYKNEPQAKLTIALNDRFMINAGVTGSTDVEGMKNIALSINFSLLDSLAKQPAPEKSDDKKVALLPTQK